MDCGASVAKYLVFIFNGLFFLAGIALITVGSLAITHNQDVYDDILPSNAPDLSGVAIVYITVGAIVTIVSFFGCCGAIRESTCMLNTFAILLILIVLAEFGVAIAALVLRPDVRNMLEDSITTFPNDSDVHWKALQTKMECCGVDGPTDWKTNSNPIYQSGTLVPGSCCATTTDLDTCSTHNSSLYTKGCYDALSKFYIIIGVVGLGFGVVEIIGIVFACCLSRAVKGQRTTV
jgi:CD63 antigen